jgi:hypothetical protein
MFQHKRNYLLIAAVAGLILVIALVIAGTAGRNAMLNETGETRREVEAALLQFLPETAASVDDPALLAAAANLSNTQYVTRLWVVDNAGKIVYHHAGPGQVGDEVRSLSGRDGRSLVAALSSDVFTGPQALQIYTAEALMVEGEHNDVFRPLVKPVPNADGRMVAIVGLSYDVSSSLSTPPTPGWIAQMLLLLLGLAVYWLSLPLWTYLDARTRGEPAVFWGLFVVVSNLVGLLAYLIVVNRKSTVHS